MRRHLVVVLGFVVVACATHVRAPSSASAPPGAPWPPGVPRCAIEELATASTASCDLIRVNVARAPGDPAFAKFESTYRQGRIVWTDLPTRRGGGRGRDAHVEATDGGLHVRGFASLDGQTFALGRRVDLVSGHAWLSAGGPVAILGTTGDRVVVSSATPFDAPATIETTVPCDAFDAASAARSPVDSASARAPKPPAAIANRARLTLHASPRGPAIFELATHGPLLWLEARDEFVRVASYEGQGGALVVDGWVRASDVRRDDRYMFDSDFGDCADSVDRCVADPQVAARAADVFVGVDRPEGSAIGTLDAGTEVVVWRRRGGFVAFDTRAGVIAGARGSLWVRESDLTRGGPCEP